MTKQRKKIKDRPLYRTLTGVNKTGRLIHGVLDVLPLPNIHEIVKKSIKTNPNQSVKEISKDVFNKIDWVRTLIGLVIAVGIIKGWFTADQIQTIINLIQQFI